MGIKVRYLPDAVRFERMTNEEVREGYLIDEMFFKDQVTMLYADLDRAIVGSAVPAHNALTLETPEELAAEYFTERREIGVMNVGRNGKIEVDGTTFVMENRDALYIGRGSQDVVFSSENPDDPARYYLISYPAHTAYPTTHASVADAEPMHIGSDEEANKRTIYKYIYRDGIKSCQLVLGFTELAVGNVWNTMPAHRHMRRSEVYCYFNLEDEAVVFHLMGSPRKTRHIVVRNCQAVISPGWSIHAGCGTQNYSFIWAMGGENQDYADMDMVAIKDML